MSTIRNPLVAAISLSLLYTAPGLAQNDGLTLELEEIVVTAQKREQSLQDVPISVSVVTGEKLVEAGIENLDDLALYVPNLDTVESPQTSPLSFHSTMVHTAHKNVP